nr:MAG TPA: hypothetical protein [Bacteriophage sp.]
MRPNSQCRQFYFVVFWHNFHNAMRRHPVSALNSSQSCRLILGQLRAGSDRLQTRGLWLFYSMQHQSDCLVIAYHKPD